MEQYLRDPRAEFFRPTLWGGGGGWDAAPDIGRDLEAGHSGPQGPHFFLGAWQPPGAASWQRQEGRGTVPQAAGPSESGPPAAHAGDGEGAMTDGSWAPTVVSTQTDDKSQQGLPRGPAHENCELVGKRSDRAEERGRAPDSRTSEAELGYLSPFPIVTLWACSWQICLRGSGCSHCSGRRCRPGGRSVGGGTAACPVAAGPGGDPSCRSTRPRGGRLDSRAVAGALGGRGCRAPHTCRPMRLRGNKKHKDPNRSTARRQSEPHGLFGTSSFAAEAGLKRAEIKTLAAEFEPPTSGWLIPQQGPVAVDEHLESTRPDDHVWALLPLDLLQTHPGRTRGPVYVHQCWAMREPLQQLLSDCEYDLERVRSPATLPIGWSLIQEPLPGPTADRLQHFALPVFSGLCVEEVERPGGEWVQFPAISVALMF
ncbi:hypothetical protein CB1_000174012 [Camelus ferus]|nr:hypothetical protein CB1_000174012 [Camelus ferus]